MDSGPILATVTRLVTVADGDTLYRDVYLRRAAELLSPIVTQARFEAALTERDHATRLLAQARVAVERTDWAQVRELSGRAADLRRALDADQEALAVADAVYGAPVVGLDPLSPGLARLAKRWPDAARARAETVATLIELARDDAPAREVYASRQQALAALVLPGAPVSSEGGRTGGSAANPEQQALQALERGDAAALCGLAEAMVGTAARNPGAAGTGAPAARGRIAVPTTLADPLPESCLPGARALGLERVEVTLASPALAAAIAEFVERYAPGASPAVFDLARDGVARASLAADEAALPKDVGAVFAETLSLFALHLYANSAGLRYVPLPVPREVLLAEVHAEGEEPVSPLLRELGFERRRGLARDDIEAGVLKNGARIVSEGLGLDPLAFRIVCVPFDVYARVGRERGWGKLPQWTHFDGYQLSSRGGRRALVGGNAGFGGLFDLCSISREDARDNVVVRFAVVRRDRLGVRIA